MRITGSMMTQTVLANIQKNLKRLSQAEGQMSSGSKVAKPSDDPVKITRIMRLQGAIREQERYEQDMKEAEDFVNSEDGALDSVTQVLARARTLAVKGANGTLTPDDQEKMAIEVDEMIDEMVSAANTDYGGQYVFGGFQTGAPPFSRLGDAITYQGDNGEIKWEVAKGVTVAVSIPGDELFQNAGGNVFDALVTLKHALEDGDQQAIGETIGIIDGASSQILSARAVLGARSDRFVAAQQRASEYKVNLTDTLAKLADIDIAEATMEVATAQNVYQAALAAGSRVIQPTLLDYLD